MKNLRICHVMFRARVGEIAGNLARMDRWAKQAAEKKAAMVVFPELSVTGYTTKKKIRNAAVAVPGPETDALVSMAAKHGVVILAGLAEKQPDGRIFAAHGVAGPSGLLGVYRKMYISPPEKPVFSPGHDPLILEAAGVRLGIQLCYDAHFPELSAQMALNGAELIVVPHASPRGNAEEKIDSWMRHLTARAYDNGIFVSAVNPVGKNGEGLDFPGACLVVDPSGRVLAQAVSHEEALLFTDLKAKALTWVRDHRMRYFLPNTRPDLWERAGRSARRVLGGD